MPNEITPRDNRNPYPIGHVRKGSPRLYAWADVVAASGRSDSGARAMRGRFPNEFPEPVCVTYTTPIYDANEIDAFLEAHPRERTRVTPEMIEEMREMYASGTPRLMIAQVFELGISTVDKHLAGR